VSNGPWAVCHPLDGLACQASLGHFLKRPSDARRARASVRCFTNKLQALGTDSIQLLGSFSKNLPHGVDLHLTYPRKNCYMHIQMSQNPTRLYNPVPIEWDKLNSNPSTYNQQNRLREPNKLPCNLTPVSTSNSNLSICQRQH
jgi:hypothetical protein